MSKAAAKERLGWSCDWLLGILLSSDRPGSAPPSEAHPVVIRTWSVDRRRVGRAVDEGVNCAEFV